MRRSSSATRVADAAHFPPPRRSMSVENGLPTFDPRSDIGKKTAQRARLTGRVIHLIPLVLIACAIILWFFSTLGMKELMPGYSSNSERSMKFTFDNWCRLDRCGKEDTSC